MIYRTFTNPASSSFAWIGAETAQIIAWQDLLLLLEGQQVNLSAAKSHFAKDVTLNGDTFIFCTTTRSLTYVKNGCLGHRKTEMMSVRWKVFKT